MPPHPEFSLRNSIVLITGNDSTQFGTGFVFYREEGQQTYVLTCAHVVKSVGKPLIVNGNPADVVIYGDNHLDLAILQVDGLENISILNLNITETQGLPFITSGHLPITWCIGDVTGNLEEKTDKPINRGQRRIKVWYLKITGDKELDEGFSGAPVFDETSRSVIGIITHKLPGNKGLAICVSAIQELWPEMPPGLIGQKAIEEVSSTSSIQFQTPRYQYIFEITGKPQPEYKDETRREIRKLEELFRHHGSKLVTYESPRASLFDTNLVNLITKEEQEINLIQRKLAEQHISYITKVLYEDCINITEKVLSRLAQNQLTEEFVDFEKNDGSLRKWIKNIVIADHNQASETYQEALVEICLSEVKKKTEIREEGEKQVYKFLNQFTLAYYVAQGLVNQTTTEGWFDLVNSTVIKETVFELICRLSSKRPLVEAIIQELLEENEVEVALRCFVNRNKDVRLMKKVEERLLHYAKKYVEGQGGNWVLGRLCSDASPEVREEIMKSFPPLLNEKIVPYLLIGLRDEEDTVRLEAAKSLHKLKNYGAHRDGLIGTLPKLYIDELHREQSLWHPTAIDTRSNLLQVLKRLNSKLAYQKLGELGAREKAQITFDNALKIVAQEQPELVEDINSWFEKELRILQKFYNIAGEV